MDITYYLHKALENAEKKSADIVDMLDGGDELFASKTEAADGWFDADAEADGVLLAENFELADTHFVGQEMQAACGQDVQAADIQDFLKTNKCLTGDDESLVREAAEIIKGLRLKAASAENDLEISYATELFAAADCLESKLKD